MVRTVWLSFFPPHHLSRASNRTATRSPHIKATPANTIPTSALAVLHAYETQGLPAPLSSYTSVITTLFSTRSSLVYAQAWDLFSHMRYVAHPQPDVFLYT